jgi:hypothetical protein
MLQRGAACCNTVSTRCGLLATCDVLYRERILRHTRRTGWARETEPVLAPGHIRSGTGRTAASTGPSRRAGTWRCARESAADTIPDDVVEGRMSHTIFIALRVCQMRPSGVGAEHHPDDVVVEIERVSVDHRRAFPLVHPRRQQHLRQSIRTAGGRTAGGRAGGWEHSRCPACPERCHCVLASY